MVAQLVAAAGLHPPPTTAASAAPGIWHGGSKRHNQVPGLTITSFHLQQVTASKKVRAPSSTTSSRRTYCMRK